MWAMKRCGIQTKGIYFIPLLGAAAVADEMFPSYKAEVFIAIIGPIWGFVLALVTAAVYVATQDPLFAAASSWMAIVNLLNLLPVHPLDGSRILKSMAFSVHSSICLACMLAGIVVSGYLAFMAGLGLFVFLLIFGTLELAFQYARRRYTDRPPMSGAEVIGSAFVYLCVAGVLWGLMTAMSHIPGAAAAIDVLKG
jgi:Zn-dependent protease